MSTSASRKEVTHDRIVRTAARIIRHKGYDGMGVADIMKEAGLTHGGFYAHFPSRTALLAEAADQAGAESLERLGKVAAGAPAGQALQVLVDAYLADANATVPDWGGCTMAALGSDTARQDPEVRRAFTRRTKEFIDLVARQLPGWGQPGQHEQAMATLSCMVGALILSRAVDEPELGRAIREAARAHLHNTP